MPRQPFQTLTHINQMVYLLILLIQLPEFRIEFQSTVYGNVQFVGNHFCNGIHKSVRQIHCPAHVTDHSLCRQCTECHNLHHFIGAVFPAHIINDLLPSVIAEINVDIGHGYSLRIQKTFKQQIIFYRIDIGNFQTIGYYAACRGSTPRPHRNPVGSGIIDKIPHNQKIIHISHGLNDTQLIIQPLSQRLSRISRLQASVPVSLRQSVIAELI